MTELPVAAALDVVDLLPVERAALLELLASLGSALVAGMAAFFGR